MVARGVVSSQVYDFGFNGKMKDDEIVGGDYDFGARIYDPRIAKFLSLDPLMSKSPGSSPYLFALNSPIICIDREGEVAIVVTIGVRITIVLVTGAVELSVVAANDGISFLITPQLGGALGLYGGGSIGLAIFPTVTSIDQLKGTSVNYGGNAALEASIGFDISQSNQSDGSTKVGGGVAHPKIGAGMGIEVHASFGYSFQIGSTIKWEDVDKAILELQEIVNSSPFDIKSPLELLDLLNTAKNEYNKAQGLVANTTKTSVKTPFISSTVKTNGSNLHIRSGAGTNADIIESVTNGSKLTLTGKTNGKWSEVMMSKGKTGWVHSDYVQKPKPVPPATTKK